MATLMIKGVEHRSEPEFTMTTENGLTYGFWKEKERHWVKGYWRIVQRKKKVWVKGHWAGGK